MADLEWFKDRAAGLAGWDNSSNKSVAQVSQTAIAAPGFKPDMRRRGPLSGNATCAREESYKVLLRGRIVDPVSPGPLLLRPAKQYSNGRKEDRHKYGKHHRIGAECQPPL